MLAWLLVFTALATPPDGYRVTREANDCTLMLGQRDADGVVPMRAECHWPDISFERLDALMSRWDHHDRYFSTVKESDLLRVEGDVAYVHQVHGVRGISDRQVVLAMRKVPIEGGFRYAWTMAGDEPFELRRGNVAVTKDDGYWEVMRHPDGGVRVNHLLIYGPGGSVPGFLVRWFQTSGLEDTVTELRTYAASSQ